MELHSPIRQFYRGEWRGNEMFIITKGERKKSNVMELFVMELFIIVNGERKKKDKLMVI